MYDLNPFKTEAKETQEWLAREYSQLHTGRASPALLDSVQVESYGSFQPLKNVASISIEDARTLRVLPWDRNTIKDIERTLHASNLGFSIAVDDAGIRVIVPVLTTERRSQLIKIAKEKMEDGRIAIRKARESMLTSLKAQILSEDVLNNAKDDVQKLVDAANAALEVTFAKKEAEVLQ